MVALWDHSRCRFPTVTGLLLIARAESLFACSRTTDVILSILHTSGRRDPNNRMNGGNFGWGASIFLVVLTSAPGFIGLVVVRMVGYFGYMIFFTLSIYLTFNKKLHMLRIILNRCIMIDKRSLSLFI